MPVVSSPAPDREVVATTMGAPRAAAIAAPRDDRAGSAATPHEPATTCRSLLRWVHRGKLRTTLLVVACLAGRPTTGTLALGSALMLLGVALHLWSKGTLVQRTTLTTAGPYRWSRNPFYLSNLLIDAGIVVTANVPWIALSLAPLWWLTYSRTIAREERFLAEQFGAAYAAYRAGVPRFLAWRRPAAAPDAGSGFTWRNRNLIQGREYARLARIVVAPLLVHAAWLARTGHFRDPARLTSIELAILVLLLGSEIVHRALIRRFDRGEHLLPRWVHARWTRLGLQFALAVTLFACRVLELEYDSLVYPAGLVAATLLGAWMLAGRDWSPAKRRASEALIFALAGWLAELPWLGVASAVLFGLLALDLVELGRAQPGIVPRPAGPTLARPAYALCSLMGFVALGLIKQALTLSA